MAEKNLQKIVLKRLSTFFHMTVHQMHQIRLKMYQINNFFLVAPDFLYANIYLNKIYYAEKFDDAFLKRTWCMKGIVKVQVCIENQNKFFSLKNF